ncbi:MAG: futalosine hydrolase [Sediminibacterium sp.]|jgi:futalosine hydrolase|nr:futalosine hydrolase [Chitinophagaceae bacterium]MCA6445681.1 futalosine hydrolase [Chitinophagaceae bacterium]
MRVVITAATTGEWMPAFVHLKDLYSSDSKRLKVQFYQSGVGLLSSAVSLTRLIYEEKPDLILQVGIAGSFNPKLSIGKTVVVGEEIIADMGVEEQKKWKDIFDLKLEKSNYPPFEKKKLPNPWLKEYNLLKLPEIVGISVNQITTGEKRIKTITKKYHPDIESMEGASLHYVCREFAIPFLQIRTISNEAGERDKTKWDIKTAINNLNKTILAYLDKLYTLK